jgi:hypothetical protein
VGSQRRLVVALAIPGAPRFGEGRGLVPPLLLALARARRLLLLLNLALHGLARLKEFLPAPALVLVPGLEVAELPCSLGRLPLRPSRRASTCAP